MENNAIDSKAGKKKCKSKPNVGLKNKKDEERLSRCREWLATLDNLSPSEQQDSFFEFVDCFTPSDDEDDFIPSKNKIPEGELGDIAQTKIKHIRSKKLVDEILEVKCYWKNCLYIGNKYEEFKRHVRKHINDVRTSEFEIGENLYPCHWDGCSFTTQCEKQIIRHIHFHSYHTKLKSLGTNVLQRFSFPECKKDSSQSNQLPKLPSPYHCQWTECGIEFNDIQEFIDHVKCHMLGADIDSTKIFQCGWLGCKRQFPNINKIKMHSKCHTYEKTVACPKCGAMFTTNSVFEDHCTRQAAALVDYRCDTCRKSFPSERLLRNHARRHINSFKCAFCDMTCSAPSALIKHMRYRHLNYRPFKCTHCDYSAVCKEDIRYHILRHEGIIKFQNNDSDEENESIDSSNKKPNGRIYSCHCCDKYFKIGARLTKHLIKIHGYSRASGFQRFRYEQSEDGYYRLIPVRYESLEVSNLIIAEQENKKLLTPIPKEFEDEEYKLIQCNKGNNEKVASFILIPPSMKNETSIKEIMSNDENSKGIKNERDSQTNIATLKIVNKTKKQKRNKRKCRSEVSPPTKKCKMSNVQTKPGSDKIKSKTHSSPKQSKTKSIQISIADIDQDGNIIKSEILESQEIVI